MIGPGEVRARIASFLKVPPERLAEGSAPLSSLVHESFVLVQLVIDLQETFEVRLVQEDLQDVKTVGDLVALIVSRG